MPSTLRNFSTRDIEGQTGPTGPGGNESLKITGLTVTDSSYVQIRATKIIGTLGGYVKIDGVGFSVGAKVFFHKTQATTVTRVSDTELNVVVPALTAGVYHVYVENSDGVTAVRPAFLTAMTGPTWVSSATLPAVTSGQAYSQLLAATGATSFALSSGSTLPAGLTLNPNGTLSGTPTTAGSYSFSILAIDSIGLETPRTFSLTVNAAGQYYMWNVEWSTQTAGSAPWDYGRTPNGVGVNVVAVGGTNVSAKLAALPASNGTVNVRVAGPVYNFSTTGTYTTLIPPNTVGGFISNGGSTTWADGYQFIGITFANGVLDNDIWFSDLNGNQHTFEILLA